MRNISVSQSFILGSLLALGFLSGGCSTTGSEAPVPSDAPGAISARPKLPTKMAEVPISSEAHYNFIRGELAYSSEHFDEALAFYQRAAQVESGEAPFLRIRLAQIAIRKGELTSALAQLDRIKESQARNPKVVELRAGILASLKRTDEAIEAYRQLIALPSEGPNEEAYVLVSSLYASSERYTESQQILRELLAKNPDSVIGTYYLARVSETRGDAVEAERLYRKALELSPDIDAIKIDLARSLGIQQRYKEGAEIVEELLNASPQNNAARQLLGQLLLGDNRFDDALTQFERLKAEGDDTSDARFKIALIKLERRDFGGAETELNLILANNAKNSSARYYLAMALSGQGRIKESLSNIRLITTDEKYYRESRILGTFLLRQNKSYDDAIALLSELLAATPTDAKLLNLMSSIQRDAGKLEDAIKTAERIVQIAPENDGSYFFLGVLYDEARRNDDATVTMRRAIDLNPQNDEALNYLGYSLADSGKNLTEAEALVRRALAIEPTNGYYIDSLAWVFFKQGKLADALVEMRKAVALLPQDAVILEHFVVVLDAAGKSTEALDVAKRALEFADESDDQGVEARLQTLIQRLEKK